MTQKEQKALKSELDDALSHLHIISVWASVGINYYGIEPKCCESVVKWSGEIERAFQKLLTLAGM